MNRKNLKIPFLKDLPTPIHHLERLSETLGVNFYIKRDDLTPYGGGGNKLRKLEYFLYDAQQKGATMLLTSGGIQTNHGRLTAAVAAKFGLKCAIVCVDHPPEIMTGNVLLDALMDAELVVKKDDGRAEDVQLEEAIAKVKAKYEAQGEVVYTIPVGGSNTVGVLGYVDCAEEIASQVKALGIEKATLMTSVGSMGTYLGLYAGLALAKSPLKLKGIAISPFTDVKRHKLQADFDEMKVLYDLPLEEKPYFDIETNYTRGGYNNLDSSVREAIYLMARQEAIFLDPCYTGKAFAGVVQMIEEGKIKKGETLIFLHTGGFPGLYTPHHRKAIEAECHSKIIILEDE